jgi:PAS domain S-box-containing protein
LAGQRWNLLFDQGSARIFQHVCEPYIMTSTQDYLFLLSAILSLLIAWLSVKKNTIPSAVSLAGLSSIVALWSMSYLAYDWKIFPYSYQAFVATTYLFSALAAASLLILALIYSNYSKWITPVTLFLLVIQPILTQVLFWIPSLRPLFFLDTGFGAFPFATPGTGMWADLHSVYRYNFEIASIVFLTVVFARKPRALLWQSGTILAGSFFPLIFRLIEMITHASVGFYDYSLFGYSVAILGFAFGVYREKILEITPITSDKVIDGMTDGWMVLDLHNNIIDLNPAAEKILGLSRQVIYGKPVRSVLPDWIDVSNATDSGKELEMRRSFKSQDNWMYLNVRLSSLKDRWGDPFGQLIVWRDITERKIAENARQRARDEMFVLLNAISNAASHSMSLDDFLSDVTYQIISPFESQMVAIFLADENGDHEEWPTLRLVVHFGLSEESASKFESVAIAGEFLEGIFRQKQPLAAPDIRIDPSVPAIFRIDEIASGLILPLYTNTGTDGEPLGAICLGRIEVKPYTQDEITRLTAISEQVATLIDSDRRRQLAIALSERERLLRDLHDSVSQKLYGLVTLTEAAQAGLEAGSKVVPSQVLAKIGDNARQAVREMRLFLYEMQPVDLEQDGLVTILHHRLAAVEGRADIQARLLADEDISLSKSKEVALYYIAQEALNNVLKHAHAQTVLVTLKQTRQNVILQVSDNGKGFDVKNVEQGGMGLQNMKFRTTQVNGKLKITSAPGAGTKIKVTVTRDRSPIQARNR